MLPGHSAPGNLALQYVDASEVGSGSTRGIPPTSPARQKYLTYRTESLQRGSERNGLPSRWRTKLLGSLEAFLAPRVLINEAAADVEILVIAGWQSGPFVLRKPLRERDHSAGRRRWPA